LFDAETKASKRRNKAEATRRAFFRLRAPTELHRPIERQDGEKTFRKETTFDKALREGIERLESIGQRFKTGTYPRSIIYERRAHHYQSRICSMLPTRQLPFQLLFLPLSTLCLSQLSLVTLNDLRLRSQKRWSSCLFTTTSSALLKPPAKPKPEPNTEKMEVLEKPHKKQC
jgi:hypothetical protein